MADVYSSGIGEAVQGVSIDSTRRVFNFGDRVAELAPQESPFFVYLSRVAKKPTDDSVFKFLEQRHQWQRRNFEVATDSLNNDVDANAAITNVQLTCKYDEYGIEQDTDQTPLFFLKNQNIAIKGKSGGSSAIISARITNVDSATKADGYAQVDLEVRAIDGDTDLTGKTDVDLSDGDLGQVTGSAFAEATGAPDGWQDELYNREGYTQIFKTAMNIFSGTTLATRYRGIANEFQRVWREKLKEHKMDVEQALLYEVGRYQSEDGTDPKRFTWGIVPYTEQFGKVYNFTFAGSTYDDFLDTMEDYFAPEGGNSGDKLVLASRKIINWLNKLETDGFLGNTVGTNSFRLDVQNVQGAFGHQVTRVNTIFGNLHFVQEPLLRGLYEDYAVAVDLKNVAYRPLQGNGISRDTHVITNVQDNDIDGRKDMILTEAGLEIQLPETHAVLKWS